MAKKEFSKQTAPSKEKPFPYQDQQTPAVRASVFSGRSFTLIKLILGICLLPFVYGYTFSFLNELYLIDKLSQKIFWAGLVAFLIVYLFIWEPANIYLKGQRILQLVFNFFSPLVKVAPFLLPIYTIIIFILYATISFRFQSPAITNITLFLAGFSVGLHLIFSAKSMRTKQKDFLKANYIFGFPLIYLINLTILAFCFSLVFRTFSFATFINTAFQSGINIFSSIIKQLFF
ncbi:MAG: hypothetical protein DRP74_01810 [Candidatus Omnitrophota bacterium]|nr:MAG: hypothetical protein DRP74_01810 [Candidatus Omnitrophota bacterium]